jgi:hypothetical protein
MLDQIDDQGVFFIAAGVSALVAGELDLLPDEPSSSSARSGRGDGQALNVSV